ncbi:MAG TPA: glucokinase [Steroidobacteraceae bacterium]|nr:glucokinase [Steroidobacteraceae bacterium]
MSGGQIMLVGDIGGTHARFATVDVSAPSPWRLTNRQDFAIDFPTFEQALQQYMARTGLEQVPAAATIAVAGPITAGQVRLTNRDWLISEEALRRFGCSSALLINDFVALAFAVDMLGPKDLRIVGPDIKGLADEPVTILGAGTGFGVSCLARHRNRVVPMSTEGGHIGFAPGDEQEVAVLQQLMRRFGRVSVERLLSGPGLENIHQALEQLAGRKPASLSAAQVADQAAKGDAGCRAALTMFCAVYGSVAGDFALSHGARGGVYIAGGIALKIEGFLLESPFRARFESKGRLSGYVKAIPTTLIASDDAALLGSARAGVSLQALPAS